MSLLNLIYLYPVTCVGIVLTECVNNATLSVLCVTRCSCHVIIFDGDMKTNYMIAIKVPAQWKTPWRVPKVDNPFNPGNQTDNKFQNMLGRTVKGVQNFLIKNMLE